MKNIDRINQVLNKAIVSFQESEIETVSENLIESGPSWKKTPDGYEMKTKMGVAKLTKQGTKINSPWVLSLGDESVKLPRKASFDHAEGILKELGAI